MATVGKRTARVIETVEPSLGGAIRRALEAAPDWLDFACTSGGRTETMQQALWSKGRDAKGDIVDESLVVTYKDGIEKLSRHQGGNAIDIVAYRGGKPTYDEHEGSLRAAYVMGFLAANGIETTGGVKWGWDQGHIERV